VAAIETSVGPSHPSRVVPAGGWGAVDGQGIARCLKSNVNETAIETHQPQVTDIDYITTAQM